MDQAARLGALIEARREELTLSVARAARIADVSRGTWIGIEKAERETEAYNFAAVEQVLGWRASSIKSMLAGGEIEQLDAAEHADVLRATIARGHLNTADRNWVERLIRTLTPTEGQPQPEPATTYFDEMLGEITDPEEQRIWDRNQSIEWRRGMIFLLRADRGQGEADQRRRAAG